MTSFPTLNQNTTGYAAGLAGGAVGSAPYQSATNTTGFIASPTTSGHYFVYSWQPSGSAIDPVALDLATWYATLTVNATEVNGASVPASSLFSGTNSSHQFVAATTANLATFLSGLTGCSTTTYSYVPADGKCEAPGSGTFNTLTGDASSTSTGGATEVVGLLNNALPSLTSGYLQWNGSTWAFGVSTGPTLQTNGSNNSSQTALNFLTSSANTSGLVATPSNPSAGGERIEVSGTYSGSLTSSQVTTALTYTPANCTAGTSGSDCLRLTSGLVPVANLPEATGPSTYGTTAGTTTTANQIAVSTTTAGTITFIDYPAPYSVLAANCVSGQPGSAWSTIIAPACRAGTYNLGGNLPFADGSTAQFEIPIPADWDSSSSSYARLDFTTGANTTGTIIFEVQLSCYTTGNSETDDQAFETAQVFSTITAAAANYANTVTLTLNSTSLTGCAAAGGMIVKITRNTDTASSVVPVTKAVITLPRKIVLQAE
jgi:hypothetical protein